MVDPVEVEAAAAQYEAAASRLSVGGYRTTTLLAESSWACDRTVRCRAEADDARRRAESLAGELCAIAAELRGVALRAREEQEQLRLATRLGGWY